jgi:histidinol-phosphate aminotransferase
MAIEFGAKTRRIPVYPAAAGYDLGDDIAMLASNESAFGPAESVQAAAAGTLSGLNRYPDPGYQPLRAALSRRYGLPSENIALGNGSCDLLLAAGDALLEPDSELLYAWPAFSVYPHLAAASGARAIAVPLDADERHDLDAMAAEITVATRLILICNPNNPTSTAVGLERIDAFMAKVPAHVAVILDEAYVEFSLTVGDTYASLALLEKYPNLVILRTFSKVYGLAALRVGYGLAANPLFRTATDQVRQPFFLNGPAQAAAVEALSRQDEVERRVASTVASRTRLLEQLEDQDVWVASSDANFIWVKLGPKSVPETKDTQIVEAEVVKGLRQRGVLVRSGAALGKAGFLRVTVGTDSDNAKFAQALAELIA